MTKKLPNSTKSLISDEISTLFEKLKYRLLNPFYKPSIDLSHLKHDKFLSMPGLYHSAYVNSNNVTKPSLESLKALLRVAESYIDKEQQKFKERAFESVENALQQASENPDYDYQTELNQAILNVFDQQQNATKTILETELQRAKTIGLQEGVIDFMEKQGISDPVMFFMTRHDKFVCKFCKEMFLLPDGITPRVYKLSELKSGYLDKNNPTPHLPPLHPNCFLTRDGRVLTENGWKPLKFVSIGEKVLTHKLQFKKVINTLNWHMTLYRKDFYSVKCDDKKNNEPLFITPDHQLWTDSGLKAIKDIDPAKDRLMKLVHNCVYCNNKISSPGPKLFCKSQCRDNFLSNVVDNVEKLEKIKYETEYFRPLNLIYHHQPAEPSFLYDITVEDDESFFCNNILTKNCRCLPGSLFLGFGFKNGKLEYISKEYDEYENQREFSKSLKEGELLHECPEHRGIL